MQPVARIDENFTFTYVGNNSNETVWPGKCNCCELHGDCKYCSFSNILMYKYDVTVMCR